MKRFLAVALAAGMMLSLSLTAFAATTTVKYPVGGVSGVGFLADDDGVVDLDSPVTSRTPVPYGKTVYFPLLNTEYNSAATSDDDLEKAKAALKKAQEEEASKKSDAETKKAALSTALTKVNSLYPSFTNTDPDRVTAAQLSAAKTNSQNKSSLEDALAKAQTALSNAKADTSAKKQKMDAAKTAWDNAKSDSTLNTKLANLKAFGVASLVNGKTYATTTDYPSKDVAYFDGSVPGGLFSYTPGWYTKSEAEGVLSAALNTAITACQTEINNLGKTEKAAYDNAKKAYDDAVSAQEKAQKDYNAANNAVKNFDTEAAKIKTAIENAEDALTKYTAAKKAYADATANVKEKQADYDAAQTQSDKSYRFVHESSAVSSAKVSASWSSGKKFINSATLVRKAAVSSTYSLNASKSSSLSTSSSTRIYFVAVETKASGTKLEGDDADGTIKVKKTGTNGFSVENTVSIWLEYQYSDNSGVIPKTPTLFDDGDGFDADDEYTFYFDEDDNSYFVVNTNHQKEILLAFDTEYDENIADKVAKSNPEADLDFYNGNYAKFNRTGKLYLSYPEKNAYVYAISSSGNVTQVTNAKYDSNEEAFVISTNTLGRYMISNEKLKALNTDSSASSSSSTPSASVSPTPPQTSQSSQPAAGGAAATSRSSSYSYTPAQSSSSPASSSSRASSSSSSSSSSEASSESRSSSSKSSSSKDSSYEDVLVKEPISTTEVPTKQKGVSWLVWALILAGLAAILVAVGVIFYTHRNSGDRML